MPIFVQTVKYTPEALAAARKEGFASREAVAKAMVESAGGRVICNYWPFSPDWDYLGIGEFPSSDAAYALQSMLLASGAIQRFKTTELRTGAEADAAIAQQLKWTPPGS